MLLLANSLVLKQKYLTKFHFCLQTCIEWWTQPWPSFLHEHKHGHFPQNSGTDYSHTTVHKFDSHHDCGHKPSWTKTKCNSVVQCWPEIWVGSQTVWFRTRIMENIEFVNQGTTFEYMSQSTSVLCIASKSWSPSQVFCYRPWIYV